MKKLLQLVKQFHKASGFDFNGQPTVEIDPKTIEFYHKLLAEESDEYLEAAKKKDLVKIADSLGDMLYVLFGIMVVHGMEDKIDDIFAEIHRSNMTKVSSKGGVDVDDNGKIIKKSHYQKPNLAQFFKEK